MIDYVSDGTVVVPFESIESMITTQGIIEENLSFLEMFKIKNVTVDEGERVLILSCDLMREVPN